MSGEIKKAQIATLPARLKKQGFDLRVADDRYNPPLNLHGLRILDVNRLHGRVSRLEANPAAFAINPLQRRLLTISQPDRDEVAILDIVVRAHDDDVAIVDHHDLDRRVDSPALSGRGSRPSGRTSG